MIVQFTISIPSKDSTAAIQTSTNQRPCYMINKRGHSRDLVGHLTSNFALSNQKS